MKKILLLCVLLSATVFFIAGCKKESTPAVNGLVAVATYVEVVNGYADTTVYNYSYDAQGRLITMLYNGMPDASYIYSTSQVTEIANADTFIYPLNSQGLAASDNYGYTYVYDSNGYLISESTNNDQYVDSFIISGGNQLKVLIISPGNPTSTRAYTYLNTPDYRNYGKAFLGKANVNLLNTETDGSNPTRTFTYTFDSKGRVQTQLISIGADSFKYTYTYVN